MMQHLYVPPTLVLLQHLEHQHCSHELTDGVNLRRGSSGSSGSGSGSGSSGSGGGGGGGSRSTANYNKKQKIATTATATAINTAARNAQSASLVR